LNRRCLWQFNQHGYVESFLSNLLTSNTLVKSNCLGAKISELSVAGTQSSFLYRRRSCDYQHRIPRHCCRHRPYHNLYQRPKLHRFVYNCHRSYFSVSLFPDYCVESYRPLSTVFHPGNCVAQSRASLNTRFYGQLLVVILLV